jgi:O-antigen/teichoic acid export membrane protein
MDVRMNGKFRISATLKNIAVNTGWLFFLRILRIGFAFFVSVWLARYLGPAQFGVLSYAFAFVTLFAPLAKLGLDHVIVPVILQNPSRKDEIVGTAFYLRFAAGILCAIAMVLVILPLQPEAPVTRALIAILAFGSLFQAYDVIEVWFHAQAAMKFPVYAKSIALVLANVAKIVLILGKAPLAAFAWVSSFEVIVGAAGLMVAYRAVGSAIKAWRIDRVMAKRLLGLGWPMILSSAFAIIYLKVDQVMLGQMTSENEVGIYSTAVRVSEVWYFMPVAIVTAVFPYLVKGKSVGQAVFRARMQQVYDFLVWISLSVAVVTTFAARFAIVLVFGEAYARSAPILEIHVWAGIFVFLREALGRWFITENLLTFAFISNGLGAVVNIALNLILIPRYKGIGAAVATVISYAVAGYFACFVLPRTREAAVMMSRALIVPLRALSAAFRSVGRRVER